MQSRGQHSSLPPGLRMHLMPAMVDRYTGAPRFTSHGSSLPMTDQAEIDARRGLVALDERSLSVKAFGRLLTFFEQLSGERRHRPSDRQWAALRDLLLTLQRLADGELEPLFYLAAIDPGIGKTRALVEFVTALTEDHRHDQVGVLICVGSLNEIRMLVGHHAGDPDASLQLPDDRLGVFTTDEALNSRGVGNAGQVLVTTHQMIQSRLRGRPFGEVSELFFRGDPRRLRVWDETLLPGRPLVVERMDLASLFKPLSRSHPEVGTAVEALFNGMTNAADGDRIAVPDFSREFGVDLRRIYRFLDGYPNHVVETASMLWSMAGCVARVRFDTPSPTEKGGRRSLVSYSEDLVGFPPLLILDASGSVRETYRQWQQSRRGLKIVATARKSYANLTIRIWPRGGGKSAFKAHSPDLAEGIAKTIRSRAAEEWLVVTHLPRHGLYDPEADIRAALRSDPGGLGQCLTKIEDRVHFVTWGSHRATNAYGHIKNVILAGTLFYPRSHYEAVGRLSSATAPDQDYDPQAEQQIKLGEFRHDLLQAICRSAARRSEGDGCPEVDVYVIASDRSGVADLMTTVFPGCRTALWSPRLRGIEGKVDQAIEFIERWFEANTEHGARLGFKAVGDVVGYEASNFRRRVREHPTFQAHLADFGLREDGRSFVRSSAFFGFTIVDEVSVSKKVVQV